MGLLTKVAVSCLALYIFVEKQSDMEKILTWGKSNGATWIGIHW